MYRFLAVLFLGLASVSIAQVAPIAKPGSPTPAVSQDTDEDDAEETPAPAQTAPPLAQSGQPGRVPAQGARPAPSVPRVVGTPARAPQPPAPAAANPQPGNQEMVRLQFPNSDVGDVLRFYEQLTGKKLLTDQFLQGKVNIFISKDVPREEAIKIIEISLLLNGFSLVPSEDSDIVKVISTGKNPRTSGVPVISNEADMPEGDHVISYLFKLRYADPQELQQALGQYLSPPQPYTSFLALPKAGAILVTENSSVIRTLVKIVDQVDVPPAEVVSEFIKLERADASKVVEMLDKVFGKDEKTGPGGAATVRGVRPGQPNVPAPANEPPELAG